MIESREKHVIITRMIRDWVDHVKVGHLLRSYDVPGLVDQIIEEFYPVPLSCGHKVKTLREGIGFVRTDEAGIHCEDCTKWYKERYPKK